MATLLFPRLDSCSAGRSDNQYLNPVGQQWKIKGSSSFCRRNVVAMRCVGAFHGGASGLYEKKKDSICTADELHFVPLLNSDWRLALWRYLPSLQAPTRNHPLLMLSGLGSNALSYDLYSECSFVRYMSNQGYDAWILEVRGSGLSTNRADTKENEHYLEQLDMILKYDWDFDHHLEEDVPAAIEYIRSQCKPKDGKLLAIGHSMGGILLYAMISRCSFNKVDPQLASIVTLGSSLDYRPSNSSLRFLLPLVDPIKAFNVPVIPIGPFFVIAHPLASRPPYIFSWLSAQISAKDMMHPSLLKKLVVNGFETVPAKVLLQLSTVFEEGGLRDRNGTFCYKDHLRHSNVPILAVAGDQDLICPPEAVYETVKLIPEQFVSYKVFGNPGGPHYAHYDIVGSRLAADQVYPLIIDFLNRHDMG